jgi:hypothetical protein
MPTETIPFEVLGHFEEIIDIETGKCYATRPVEYLDFPDTDQVQPLADTDRRLPPAYGYAGRVERLFKKGEEIIKDYHHKGLGKYKFPNDAKCWIITHPLCGRMKPRALQNAKEDMMR